MALFGDVIGRLADDTDVPAKVELSKRMAAIDNAPAGLIARLADDEAIDVAAPVLTNSTKLDEAQLAALASTKSERHMLAIANREGLSEQVTDALLMRGDKQIAKTVANNATARVSDKGYETLVDFAAKDPTFAECVIGRQDIPPRHIRTLVAVVPESVRRRLAETNPQLAERIRRALAEATQKTPQIVRRDYTQAKKAVQALADAGTLDEGAVQEFAECGQFEETAVALATLLRLPIDSVGRLLADDTSDAVLIAAKAAGLSWTAAKELVLLRNAGRSSPQDIENARLTFNRLKTETAKQGIQFYKARTTQE